jgi:hypothetical protein
VKLHARTRICLPGPCGWAPSAAARPSGDHPRGDAAAHPRVVADAVFSLVLLLGYATIGLVVTLRRPATRPVVGAVPRRRQVSLVRSADLQGGGQVRRAIQVLGIALMAAGLLFDASVRNRNRGAGRTSDKHLTSRLPLVLFWIGAVLVVLSSI